MIKKLFSSDIKKALQRAREDERKKTENDWKKKLDDELLNINNKHQIKIKELENENNSMLMRLQILQAKEKQIDKDRHEINYMQVKLKHILSTLSYFAEKDRLDRAEREAIINRMHSELLEIEEK